MTSVLALVALAAPLAFVLAAFAARLQPGPFPQYVERLSMAAAGIGLVVAVTCAVLTAQHGLILSPTLGFWGLGFSIRLDPLSVVMFCMIALLAVLIVHYSRTYLEGDARHGVFLGRLTATIASVMVLVLAGNLGLFVLAWLATSLSLHTLLVFYPERPAAVIAGRKKFIAARIGDVCLVAAAGLLYLQFGTGDLEAIFSGMQATDAAGWAVDATGGAALLLAVAALLKSAQFPTHGWLVEVMETPTPVSALLHAGILNAGPFLVTRFAFVMDGAILAQALLIIVGGFTALFASSALLTQPTIKVALGYSSAAHMGFMLLVCGLGVYAAAILHLVAHSFYKAHAFLSSGSVVDERRAAKVRLPRRLGQPMRILGSIVIAMGVYVGFSLLWGINPVEELALFAIGAILVMGLAQIIAPALDSDGPLVGTLRACGMAVAVAIAFFSLETGAEVLLKSVIPPLSPLGPFALGLTVLVLLAFGTVVVLQILGPSLPRQSRGQRFAIHLRNGFYANAWFDRLVGALRTGAPDRPIPPRN
ncbi:MAG: NADH/ubiquinone/plastoquinone (complex i) [Bacteroidetes bacterium]|jgi:NAD(P)H-quinone oxidoreductase subunit 5|nr:NADH/ubiquinone/plastoquinone (complex i) [Bacteroidota bacterium]